MLREGIQFYLKLFYSMSEWHESKRKPNSNFRKLLQERIEQANPRLTFNIEEQRRLSKLEVIADKLRRGENVQSRQLQTWLDEFDNASEGTRSHKHR